MHSDDMVQERSLKCSKTMVLGDSDSLRAAIYANSAEEISILAPQLDPKMKSKRKLSPRSFLDGVIYSNNSSIEILSTQGGTQISTSAITKTPSGGHWQAGTTASGAISTVYINHWHDEPLAALQFFMASSKWYLVELLEGHDFLIICQVDNRNSTKITT